MISFPKNLLILISLVVFSCRQEIKELPIEKSEGIYENPNRLDSLNKSEATKLSSQLDAIAYKDSVFNFTYQVQKTFKTNDRPISFTGFIEDIIQKDNNFVIKIYGAFAKLECNAEILVTPEQFYELYKQLDLKRSNKGCFIFKPTNIKSGSVLSYRSELTVYHGAETVDEANEAAESELTHTIEAELFFKGNLIDYYLYKRIK